MTLWKTIKGNGLPPEYCRCLVVLRETEDTDGGLCNELMAFEKGYFCKQNWGEYFKPKDVHSYLVVNELEPPHPRRRRRKT